MFGGHFTAWPKAVCIPKKNITKADKKNWIPVHFLEEGWCGENTLMNLVFFEKKFVILVSTIIDGKKTKMVGEMQELFLSI